MRNAGWHPNARDDRSSGVYGVWREGLRLNMDLNATFMSIQLHSRHVQPGSGSYYIRIISTLTVSDKPAWGQSLRGKAHGSVSTVRPVRCNISDRITQMADYVVSWRMLDGLDTSNRTVSVPESTPNTGGTPNRQKRKEKKPSDLAAENQHLRPGRITSGVLP